MKNTMKIKSLLSFFVPAAILSLSVASCSDYDNGYNEKAIRFAEDFRKAYGDIDPKQDWNLAERGTVTVSTMKESRVKIYVFSAGEYHLVGDYEGIQGTQMLGFDMLEGTVSILVTDGETSQKTVPGGVVTFGGTRTTWGGEGPVKISKIEDANGLPIETTGKTYPKYIEATPAEYEKVFNVVPEIGNSSPRYLKYTNLNRVDHDFYFTSNGKFIIYPFFWNTSSLNTLGLYYFQNGEKVPVPIYQHKYGNEVQYATASKRDDFDFDNAQPRWSNDGVVLNKQNKTFTWNRSYDNAISNLGLSVNNISDYQYLTIHATLLDNTEEYRVFFIKDGGQKTITITQSGSYTIDLSTLPDGYWPGCSEILLSGGATNSGSVKVDAMYLWGGELTWHNYEIPSGQSDAPTWGECNRIFSELQGVKMRSQGIVVDIPEGTVFGMYLEKDDGTGTFYSQREYNTNVGKAMKDNLDGKWEEDNNTNAKPCYASTFKVGDQLYLGFEDWPNNDSHSDFDLNDMIFAFDGCEPTIINEDPRKAEWLLVCEDLGGSFDTDYNDVIFKVEHVSGREYANVTAMAAGGTLASYICFCDPTDSPTASHDDIVVGEIHQMFDAAPEASGAYSPINAYSRYQKSGKTYRIPVDKDWQIAYNVDANEYTAAYLNDLDVQKNKAGVNMGGFYILTLPAGQTVSSTPSIGELGNNASRIAAPGPGTAPYILCLPYTYDLRETKNGVESINYYVWAWPQELCTICSATYSNGKYTGTNGGAYSRFADWVGDYTNAKDWYKVPTNNMIVERVLVRSTNAQGVERLASPLTNIGTWVVGSGNTVNLKDNLVNSTTGTLHYKYNGQTTENENFTPTTAGTYTIEVTQDATTDYLEGSTTITIVVPRKIGEYKFTVQTTNNSSTNNGLNTNLALAVDGDQLELKTVANNDNQTWIAEDAGDGKVYLRNKGTNQYLGCNSSTSWDATFSVNPVANARGRFTIQDMNGGKTILIERNGDRGLKAGAIANGQAVHLNAKWNTPADNYIIWGTSGQQQTSPLGNNGNKTISVDEVINLRANLTNVTEGTLKYYLTVPNVVSNWEINDPTTFAPDKAGEHRIHVVLTKSNGTQETTDFTVTVNAKNNGGGDSSSTKTYDFPGSYESDINMTIEKSGDTYNVKYNGNTIMSGITSLTVNWTSTGNFWLYSSKYTYQSTQYQGGGSGDITLSSSDLSNLVSNSETLVASYNNYGRITVSLTGN